VVSVHLPGFLSGVSGKRLLCDRRAADSQGGDAAVEWEKIHDDGRKYFRPEHLRSVRDIERQGLAFAIFTLPGIEKRRLNRFYNGPATQPVGNQSHLARRIGWREINQIESLKAMCHL